MALFARHYFPAAYFPGRYFPPLEDAEAGAGSLTITNTAGQSSMINRWWRRYEHFDEPRVYDDDTAIILALTLLLV